MWKQVQVVMLPTNEKAKDGMLCLRPSDNKLAVINVLTVDDPNHIILSYKNQHLYFLSDEEIKEGDWFIHTSHGKSKIKKAEKIVGKSIVIDKGESSCWVDYSKKIIATTDSSLEIEILEGPPEFTCEGIRYGTLPQPSQDFIKLFVEEYNKGNIIEWVDVEHEFDNIGHRENPGFHNQKLKVNSKNEINIKPIENSYSREQVVEFGKKVKEYCENGWKDDNIHRVFFDWDKFISENL